MNCEDTRAAFRHFIAFIVFTVAYDFVANIMKFTLKNVLDAVTETFHVSEIVLKRIVVLQSPTKYGE